MSERICSTCGLSKELDSINFEPDRECRGGYRPNCRDCRNKDKRARRGSNGVVGPAVILDQEVVKLVEAARSPITFSALCNKLDLSPKKTEALIKKAIERKAAIHVQSDVVSIAAPPSAEVINDIAIAQAVGDRLKVGALSDTHLGSRYCLRGALRETIHWMYDNGVREILHAGDILEGCYRHAQYELSHVGFDDQLRDAFKC